MIKFYANMEKEIRDPTSRKFEKVFVRNNVVTFSPAVINVFLGTSDIELEEPLVDYDAITLFLTGGKLTKWSKRLPSSRMTFLYGFLHNV